jgi:hypothetical protein
MQTSRDIRIEAGLWRTVRAAARLIDGLDQRGTGIYEVTPELVLALKQAVDFIRPALKRHDQELMEVYQ